MIGCVLPLLHCLHSLTTLPKLLHTLCTLTLPSSTTSFALLSTPLPVGNDRDGHISLEIGHIQYGVVVVEHLLDLSRDLS